MSEKPVASIKTLARYEPDTVYIGTGEYVAECVRADDGDYYLAADVDAAIEALQAEIERLHEQLRLALRDAAPAVRGEPVAWPLASLEEADKGWTLDYRFIEQVERIASQHTDYATSMEATEQVLIAANEVLRASQPADEELRRDAARYRWLRDPCSGAERVIFYCRGDYGRGLMSGTMLDAAIDAAMREEADQ